jgi:hypothetical protein
MANGLSISDLLLRQAVLGDIVIGDQLAIVNALPPATLTKVNALIRGAG